MIGTVTDSSIVFKTAVFTNVASLPMGLHCQGSLRPSTHVDSAIAAREGASGHVTPEHKVTDFESLKAWPPFKPRC